MSDGLFHIIEDMQIVLRTRKGVYKQTKVYHRDGKLYAAHAGGYARLLASGGTSCPDLSWEALPNSPAIACTALEIKYIAPANVPRLVEG